MRVLGIDGGGASLKISEVTEAGANRKIYHVGANLLVAQHNLERLFRMLKKNFGAVDAISCACSGAGDKSRKERLRTILRDQFPNAILEVMSDAEGTYTACLGSRPGVVVISGTGSIVYGKDATGRSYRAGGWGYIFDDEGSAFWIAKELVRKSLQFRDGLVTYDPIFDILLPHFKVQSVEALVGLQMDLEFRAKIASVTKTALENPTELVLKIVDSGTALLAKRALKVAESVGPVKCIYVYGGNFNSQLYRSYFEKHLEGVEIKIFLGKVDEVLASKLYEKIRRERVCL